MGVNSWPRSASEVEMERGKGFWANPSRDAHQATPVPTVATNVHRHRTAIAAENAASGLSQRGEARSGVFTPAWDDRGFVPPSPAASLSNSAR